METGKEVDSLKKRLCEDLQLTEEALNQMILKGVGRLLKSVASTNYEGVIGRLINGRYLANSPSEKVLRLLSQGSYTKRKGTNNLSIMTSQMLCRVLEPLDVSAAVFFRDYLIHCDLNQATNFLPEDFVSRTELQDEIVSALLGNPRGSHQSLWLTSTLTGPGGVGKSSLAAAVGCDQRIQHNFFDGIIWLEVGDNDISALNEKASSLASFLTRYWKIPSTYAANNQGDWNSNEYRKQGIRSLAEAIGQRHVLVIVDDVWDQLPVRWLSECLSNCENSRLLFTSRISDLAGPNAPQIRIDQMSNKEATQLLLSDFEERSNLAFYAAELLVYTGCWPLLVKLTKGLIHLASTPSPDTVSDATSGETQAFQEVLEKLRVSGVVELTDVNQQMETRHANLGVVIRHSLEALTLHPEIEAILNQGNLFGFSIQFDDGEQLAFKDARGLFQSFALFPEDTHIYANMVAPIWRMNTSLVNQFFTLLHRFSLVDYFGEDENGTHIRLHDEVSRYVCQLLEGYSKALHCKWLDAFASAEELRAVVFQMINSNDSQSTLPTYFWRQHGYHMMRAGRYLELTKWLIDPLYLTVRSHIHSSTHKLEEEVYACLEKSFIDPTVLPYSSELEGLQKRLPHIAHWPIDFDLADWLPNIQANLIDILDARKLVPCSWSLHAGWEKWLLPPSNLARTLTPHEDSVLDVIIATEDFMVSCSSDGSLRVFDWLTGETIVSVTLDDEIPNCICSLSQNHYLVGTNMGKIHICHFQDKSPRFSLTLSSNDEVVWCEATIKKTVIILQSSGIVSIWKAFSDKQPECISGQLGAVRCCLIDDDELLWLASMDGNIQAIDLNTLEKKKQYQIARGTTSIEKREELLLVCSENGLAEVWNTQEDRRLQHWKSETSDNDWACLLPGSKVFYLAGHASAGLLTLTDGKHHIFTENTFPYDGELLMYWQDNLVVFPTPYDTLVVFDTELGEIDHEFNPHSNPISCIKTLQGRLLSAGDQGQMSLWHSDREKVAQLSESNNGIGCEISQCISLSDGSFLSAGVVTRWSKGGVKERVLGPIYGDVELFFNSIAIFENGHVLSVIDSEKWVIWDSATESIVKEVEAPIKLAIHSDIHILDGYRLTVHQNEYTQIMVDCYKGEILGKYSGHLNMVNSVGRLSNGKYFSTAWDNTIHIWSFEDTKDATILKGHTDAVMSALELSDNRLLSVSNDGSAKIWDLNAECILLTVTPSEHDFKLSGLGQCAVLSGGMYALASLDRVVYLYDSEWTKVGMMRVRSDIGLLKAVDRNQLLIGQKDGSLLMVDVFPSG